MAINCISPSSIIAASLGHKVPVGVRMCVLNGNNMQIGWLGEIQTAFETKALGVHFLLREIKVKPICLVKLEKVTNLRIFFESFFLTNSFCKHKIPYSYIKGSLHNQVNCLFLDGLQTSTTITIPWVQM